MISVGAFAAETNSLMPGRSPIVSLAHRSRCSASPGCAAPSSAAAPMAKRAKVSSATSGQCSFRSASRSAVASPVRVGIVVLGQAAVKLDQRA